ncbi:DNA-binding protein [Mesorhizobium sp. CN2-181]|uniref:DNA-binding protein n=1 Tax=Mesorhizobium yinganensis TaxID=3157707 RepID=UPI0032B703D0
MDDTKTENDLELIWGGEAIARELGRKLRITQHMLEKGHIKGAKKVCGRWCVSRHALRKFFEVEAA